MWGEYFHFSFYHLPFSPFFFFGPEKQWEGEAEKGEGKNNDQSKPRAQKESQKQNVLAFSCVKKQQQPNSNFFLLQKKYQKFFDVFFKQK